MKVNFILILSVLLLGFVFAGDGTGADAIFEEYGVEKPVDWDSMSRDARWEYLQENNLYPPEGQSKYEGEARLVKDEIVDNMPVEDYEKNEFFEDERVVEGGDDFDVDSVLTSDAIAEREGNNNLILIIGVVIFVIALIVAFFVFRKRM